MPSFSHIIALVAATLSVTAAPVPSSAPTPQPSLTSAEDNVAYAVAAVCAPYVLEGVAADVVLAQRHLVLDDGFHTPLLDGLESRPVRVGFAGFVHAGVGEPHGRRTCEVFAKGADPQKLRAAVLRVVRARPEGFQPARSRYLPGRFASEDRLCAGAGSAKPNATLLMSAAQLVERDRIAMLITFSDAVVRDPPCDRDDVPANYRTLIPPGEADPSPPPPR